MHYSHLLFALPLASAISIDRREPAQYADAVITVQETAIETAVATTIITVTVGAGAKPTDNVKAADSNVGAPQYYQGHHMWSGHGGNGPPSDNQWSHVHHPGQQQPHAQAPAAQPQQPAPAAPVKQQPAPVQPKPQPVQPKPVEPKPRPAQPKPQPNPPTTGGSGGAGCPPDSSSPRSPGMNGHPERSMIDSINEIRRMYTPNAACLKWSPTLATASEQCVNIGAESALRANSGIVSDIGYGEKDVQGNLKFEFWKATTMFENSIYLLLCQKDDDPLLTGTGNNKCGMKVGEIGCTPGSDSSNPSCTGHRDMVLDAKGEQRFMGAACNEGTHWMSASFSKTYDIFD